MKLDRNLLLVIAAITLLIGGGSNPLVVVPPNPQPKPTQPAKIDLPGPAVLMAYQDADLHSYTQQQRDAISGHIWRDKVPQGNWRILDNEAEFTGPSPFKAPFDRRPKNLPWVVISGPGEQYEGPFESAAEVAQLVEGASHE